MGTLTCGDTRPVSVSPPGLQDALALALAPTLLAAPRAWAMVSRTRLILADRARLALCTTVLQEVQLGPRCGSVFPGWTLQAGNRGERSCVPGLPTLAHPLSGHCAPGPFLAWPASKHHTAQVLALQALVLALPLLHIQLHVLGRACTRAAVLGLSGHSLAWAIFLLVSSAVDRVQAQ